MALGAGARFGPYEIVNLVGAGGMGEVYRARDTRLGRDVAIKIVPAQFVADAERVARFQREARTLASLNHPNIGGIYGLEEAASPDADEPGTIRALVLEFVDGPTLAEIISGSGLKARALRLRHQARCRLTKLSRSRCRLRRRSKQRTSKASFIAT